MDEELKTKLSKFLAHTPLQYVPVKVRKGLAKGAKWTLLPLSQYWRGETECEVEAAIKSWGDIKGATCWDLGAHFGIYTVGMALAVGWQGKVCAFEPDPISYKRLARHVKMNYLKWVSVYNYAVSDTERVERLMLLDGAGATTSHFSNEDETFDSTVPFVEAQTVVLDYAVETKQIPAPDFIKVDVEGHGAKALKGAIKTVTGKLPPIVMSFHSTWELNGTRELLEPLGYNAFDAAGERLEWDACLYRTAILRKA